MRRHSNDHLARGKSSTQRIKSYRTVEDAVPFVTTLLDVVFQSGRIQWLQQFKATEELARDGHDSAPVVEFAAILVLSEMARES